MVRYAVALGCLALALTASAGAATQRDSLIRPGVGIGKVKLGMTIAQVRAAWGPAQARTVETQPRGSREIELQYDFAAYTVRLVGRPKRERVVSVATTLRREKTRQGVGVGSLERRLRRQFRGELHCDRLPVALDARGFPLEVIYAGAVRRCTLGDRDGRHTVFTSRVHPKYPWDLRPIADWLELARVMEVVVRGPGAPRLPGEQS